MCVRSRIQLRRRRLGDMSISEAIPESCRDGCELADKRIVPLTGRIRKMNADESAVQLWTISQ